MEKLINLAVSAIFLLSCSLVTTATEQQVIATPSHLPLPSSYSSSLFKPNNGEDQGCWNSVIELDACTTEIIMFFLNKETYLGDTCCVAIRTIMHKCWPGLLTTLGFTSEEGDLLDSYCDKATAPPAPQTVTPLPPPPVAGIVPN